jgi:hypothetical protein
MAVPEARMPRPDTGLIGPERATMGDVDALNRLFAEAFTDRYHRDGMSSVRVPSSVARSGATPSKTPVRAR